MRVRSCFFMTILFSLLLLDCARYPAIPELQGDRPSEIQRNVEEQKREADIRELVLAMKKSEPGDYIIGKKDILKVEVWGERDLTREVEVSQDGTISLPLIGKVPADGKTVSQVQEMVTDRLNGPYFIDPQVTVTVVKYQSKTVSVLGEVGGKGGKGSGRYPLRGRTTLLEILTEAGLSDQGSDECIVIRPKKEGGTEAGDKDLKGVGTVIRISLPDLMKGDLLQNIELQDGDTIYLPKAEHYYVFGQVHNPGKYKYRQGTTVLKAISTAGGVTEKAASVKKVRILREEGGKKQRISVNPTDLVKPEDTVIVPESFF